MQAAPSNPDKRPLPPGWAEHFDSQRRLWYYIDLDGSTPRVTFVHPSDESIHTHPASAPAFPVNSTASTSSTSSSASSTSTSRRTGGLGSGEHSRLAIRPAGSRENPVGSASSSNSMGPRNRRATVAQQLYASSLTRTTTAPSHSRRPSVSSTHTYSSANSNSISDEYAPSSFPGAGAGGAGGSSPTFSSAASAQNAHSHALNRARTNSTATSATAPSAASASVKPASPHDPRNVFDYTRLSRGTRRMTYNGPQPGPGNGQPPQPAASSFVAASSATSSSSAIARHHEISPSSSSSTHLAPPSRASNPTPSISNLTISSESTVRSISPASFSEQAQALYPSYIISKPLQATSSTFAPPSQRAASHPLKNTTNDGVSATTTSASSLRSSKAHKSLPPVPSSQRNQDLKPKPHVPDAFHKQYTARTADDNNLMVMPSPSPDPFAAVSGITEDNLVFYPGYHHQTPAQAIIQASRSAPGRQLPPTINVVSLQNPSENFHRIPSSSPMNTISTNKSTMRIQTKLTRRNTVASASSPTDHQRPVLQQPKPVRPLGGVPMSLNLQVQVAEQAPSLGKGVSEGSAGKDKEKNRVRKGFGFGGMSLFGPRTRQGSTSSLREVGPDSVSLADESFIFVNSS